MAKERHALPEHWTELSAARIHGQQLAEQLDEMRTTCYKECGKTDITKCEKCYPKALDKIRARYCDAQDREWFSQRTAFLIETDMLLTDVSKGKIGLGLIESSIASEKEAWYRWVLRTYPGFLAAGGNNVDQEELRDMLNDPDVSREDLFESIWKGVGRPEEWSDDVETLANAVVTAKDNPSELKKLYISLFFKDRRTGQVLEYAQKYLDAYEASDAMTIEEVMDMIAHDQAASMNTQPQRDGHKARLDELRRAKMAFEANRAQNKSRAQAAQTPAIADDLYDLPPCLVCEKAVDTKSVIACPICQAVSQMGGQKKFTVYCSDECYNKGNVCVAADDIHGVYTKHVQDDHVDKEHDCEAGDNCAQYHEEGTDNDENLESVVCKDCIGEKTCTVYCSQQCAVENLPRHRQDKHGVKTATEEAGTLVLSLKEFVENTLREVNPGLKFSYQL